MSSIEYICGVCGTFLSEEVRDDGNSNVTVVETPPCASCLYEARNANPN